MSRGGYGSFARYYDRLQKACGTDYEEIGEYYKRILVQNGVSKGILLDLACGTGVLSRYFEKSGYDVIGTDASFEMLNAALSEKEPNSNIQYLSQDMTALDLYGTVDACICVLDGFNHLDGRNGVKKAFEKVSLFINTGGVFVFDVNTLHKHKNILSGSSFVFELEELFCVWRNFSGEDNDEDTVDVELDFFKRNGKGLYSRETECFSEKAYSINEITILLEECSFKVIGCYDWLTFNKGNEDCEKVVFAAVKK